MPYHSPYPDTIDNNRLPVFVVFHKGEIIRIGTADELQYIFNRRSRVLKLTLLRLCDGPDEDQLENEFQVMRLSRWEQLKTEIVDHCDRIIAENSSEYRQPESVEDEEFIYNPRSLGLLERKRMSGLKYHRYKRKHLVQRYRAEASLPPPPEVVMGKGEMEKVIKLSDAAALSQAFEDVAIESGKQERDINSSALKWDTKLTDLEQEYLDKKRARRNLPEPKIWY